MNARLGHLVSPAMEGSVRVSRARWSPARLRPYQVAAHDEVAAHFEAGAKAAALVLPTGAGPGVRHRLPEQLLDLLTGPREPILVAMAAATKLCERALELGDLEAAARGAEAAARLAEVRQRE